MKISLSFRLRGDAFSEDIQSVSSTLVFSVVWMSLSGHLSD